MNEAQMLGLDQMTDSDSQSAGPTLLRYRRTVRVRRTGPKVVQYDYGDGRMGAVVSPDTVRTKKSISGREQ